MNILFPLTDSVHVLCISLASNGTSSYRDAENISHLTSTKWNAKTTIFTDKPDYFSGLHNTLVVKPATLQASLRCYVQALPDHCSLLVAVSGHGYSTHVPSKSKYELNHRNEYIRYGHCRVFDYDLTDLLCTNMKPGIDCLYLVDTCHSGTMFDLPYLSIDGGRTYKHSNYTTCSPVASILCISACNDNEQAGEDISTYGGWGGKLISYFLDRLNDSDLDLYSLCTDVHRLFSTQKRQRTHPIISRGNV